MTARNADDIIQDEAVNRMKSCLSNRVWGKAYDRIWWKVIRQMEREADHRIRPVARERATQ